MVSTDNVPFFGGGTVVCSTMPRAEVAHCVFGDLYLYQMGQPAFINRATLSRSQQYRSASRREWRHGRNQRRDREVS